MPERICISSADFRGQKRPPPVKREVAFDYGFSPPAHAAFAAISARHDPDERECGEKLSFNLSKSAPENREGRRVKQIGHLKFSVFQKMKFNVVEIDDHPNGKLRTQKSQAPLQTEYTAGVSCFESASFFYLAVFPIVRKERREIRHVGNYCYCLCVCQNFSIGRKIGCAVEIRIILPQETSEGGNGGKAQGAIEGHVLLHHFRI